MAKSKKLYQKGRKVESIDDLIQLCRADARFIKDDPFYQKNPEFAKLHPRHNQVQTAAFMRVQQFGTVTRWIAGGYLFVAEPISAQPKLIKES